MTKTEILKLIEIYTPDLNHKYNNQQRYLQKNVPIQFREFKDSPDYKVNNKLSFDFFGKMVNIKNNYFLGNPIVTNYNAKDDKIVDAEIQKMKVDNNFDSILNEVGKEAAITGVSYIYVYYYNNEFNIEKLKSWEVIPIYNNNKLIAILRQYAYYSDDYTTINYFVDYIDDKSIINYQFNDSKTDLTEIDQSDHFFGTVPVIEFNNNAERMGNIDKVFDLIDDYDRNMSDLSSEIEQFSLALIILTGMQSGEEFTKKARKTGAISLKNEKANAKFITKNLDTTAVEFRKNTLREDIFDIANIPNLTDKNFIGNASGVALKYKLFGLEGIRIETELQFKSGLYNLFKLFFKYLENVKQIKADIYQMEFVFTPNLPIDITSEADALAKLKGVVSERTALSKSRLVTDVNKELEQLQEDESKVYIQ